jgi:hypothetical protein
VVAVPCAQAKTKDRNDESELEPPVVCECDADQPGHGSGARKEIRFSEFLEDLESGKIEEVTIRRQNVSGIYRADKETFHTTTPGTPI